MVYVVGSSGVTGSYLTRLFPLSATTFLCVFRSRCVVCLFRRCLPHQENWHPLYNGGLSSNPCKAIFEVPPEGILQVKPHGKACLATYARQYSLALEDPGAHGITFVGSYFVNQRRRFLLAWILFRTAKVPCSLMPRHDNRGCARRSGRTGQVRDYRWSCSCVAA